MPPYDPRAFIKLMFWSISFLLICTYLFGSEVSTKDKVIEVLEKIEQVEKEGKILGAGRPVQPPS